MSQKEKKKIVPEKKHAKAMSKKTKRVLRKQSELISSTLSGSVPSHDAPQEDEKTRVETKLEEKQVIPEEMKNVTVDNCDDMLEQHVTIDLSELKKKRKIEDTKYFTDRTNNNDKETIERNSTIELVSPLQNYTNKTFNALKNFQNQSAENRQKHFLKLLEKARHHDSTDVLFHSDDNEKTKSINSLEFKSWKTNISQSLHDLEQSLGNENLEPVWASLPALRTLSDAHFMSLYSLKLKKLENAITARGMQKKLNTPDTVNDASCEGGAKTDQDSCCARPTPQVAQTLLSDSDTQPGPAPGNSVKLDEVRVLKILCMLALGVAVAFIFMTSRLLLAKPDVTYVIDVKRLEEFATMCAVLEDVENKTVDDPALSQIFKLPASRTNDHKNILSRIDAAIQSVVDHADAPVFNKNSIVMNKETVDITEKVLSRLGFSLTDIENLYGRFSHLLNVEQNVMKNLK